MDIVSIIFLIIIGVFAIIGIFKGFINTIISLAGGLIAFFAAALLAEPCSKVFMELDFILSGKQSIYNWLLSLNPAFGETFYSTNKEPIVEALNSLNFPSFLSQLLADRITPLIPEEGIYLGEVVSYTLMSLIVSIVSFILLFLIFKLLIFLLKKLFAKLLENIKPIKAFDRLLGGLFGIFAGLMIIGVLCIGITMINSVPFFADFSNMISTEIGITTDNMTFARFLYEHNLLMMIFMLIF